MASSSSKPEILIPGLPNELAISCIARVPFSFHQTLAHVSRSWRSLLLSPSFPSIRSQLNSTDSILTIAIRNPKGESQWYHLLLPHHHRRRHRRLPLPSPPLPQAVGSTCTSLGPHLFLLGGIGSPTSVQIYDPFRRRWARGPPMSTDREFASAGAAEGKVHVLGGRFSSPDGPWAESLDPTSTRWDPVPDPPSRYLDMWMMQSAVMDEKLVTLFDHNGYREVAAFDPATSAWDPVPPSLLGVGPDSTYAVVGGVHYRYDYDYGRILGFDRNESMWTLVEGLERGFPYGRRREKVTLVSLGGLLCAVCEETRRKRRMVGGYGGKEKVISYAGIDITPTYDGGFRGSVRWFESDVLTYGEYLSCCDGLVTKSRSMRDQKRQYESYSSLFF